MPVVLSPGSWHLNLMEPLACQEINLRPLGIRRSHLCTSVPVSGSSIGVALASVLELWRGCRLVARYVFPSFWHRILVLRTPPPPPHTPVLIGVLNCCCPLFRDGVAAEACAQMLNLLLWTHWSSGTYDREGFSFLAPLISSGSCSQQVPGSSGPSGGNPWLWVTPCLPRLFMALLSLKSWATPPGCALIPCAALPLRKAQLSFEVFNQLLLSVSFFLLTLVSCYCVIYIHSPLDVFLWVLPKQER